ncbi:MAG: BamA/TamA family outer membrane protein [Flavobacteriaceae bacterium]|nr:BamA/TamA family outer membrane protein [Flavobacteriaceae bacterium]
MKNKFLHITFLFILFLNFSCSINKFIPEDEVLYKGASINYKGASIEKSTRRKVDDVLFPKPNKKVLWMRPGLYFHYKTRKEKPGFFNRFMNKQIGERPVYLSQVDVENTEEVMKNRLENSGFFQSLISSEVSIDTSKNRASVTYEIELKEAYRLAKLELEKNIEEDLPIWEEISSYLETTKLKPGSRFSLDQFKKERGNLDDCLKDRGYYNFNPNFVIFEADTNAYDQKQFDLYVKLKEETPKKSLYAFEIQNLNVYPKSGLKSKEKEKDTVTIDNIHFIQNEVFFKPERLRPFLRIEPNDLYSPRNSRFTSRRLNSTQTYRFVNIDYEEVELDTTKIIQKLNGNIYLSPANKRSVRLEMQGVTKSNNFTGPNLNLTYINRNIFKGGEQFKVSLNGGYERQFLGDQGGLSSLQLGLRNTLSFPRLLFPIDLNERFDYSIPKTNLSLGFDYLNRTGLYTLTSVSTGFGYSWDQNRFVNHNIKPINIEIVQLGNTSNEFEEILDNNPFLRRSFDQQFIAGLVYSFTYSQLKEDQVWKNFFNFNFESAGNTVDLFAREKEETRKIFGTEFAQFVKADIDYRFNIDLDEEDQKLVGRLFGGLGLPYGNSEALPFVKQYFAGGPYSVRAFRIRSLGPGSYVPETGSQSFFDQAGDIRLEANLEYRFPIFSYLKGAVFYDAGNVWLLNDNEALPGGKFSSNFLDELGMGTGVGLRVDVQGFVIRFDFAAPLKRPARSWRFEPGNTLLNFAIGYPF